MSGLRVWKFRLRWGHVTIALPKHARIVHVGADPASGFPCVWATVIPEMDEETRRFVVVATGQETPLNSVHLGTFVDGAFVWHVFEEIR